MYRKANWDHLLFPPGEQRLRIQLLHAESRLAWPRQDFQVPQSLNASHCANSNGKESSWRRRKERKRRRKCNEAPTRPGDAAPASVPSLGASIRYGPQDRLADTISEDNPIPAMPAYPTALGRGPIAVSHFLQLPSQFSLLRGWAYHKFCEMNLLLSSPGTASPAIEIYGVCIACFYLETPLFHQDS